MNLTANDSPQIDDLPRLIRIGEPLRTPLFRQIWLTSLLSNLGLMIQGVGAAWIMTELTPATDMVALVQTALMLPILLLSIVAGAIADMHDRRKVGLFALWVSFSGAAGLTAATAAGLLTPWLLLTFCFAIGTGMALFGPAWQASVSEQVPADAVPQAVALNSISYNIARSFGPAIGGVLVAAAGAVTAFAANAILYLPILVVFLLWRRTQVPPRLPPERIDRAIASGLRFITHSPSIRIVLWRTFVTGVVGGSVSALMPIVARDSLGGGAQTYGLILGAFGVGAVAGALNIGAIRRHLSGEAAVCLAAIFMASGILTVALSSSIVLTACALVASGAAWMVCITLFNIGVQLAAPRWVAGRALAGFQAAIAGGIAIGSWLWGQIAQDHGVAAALQISAGAMAVSPLLGRWFRMPPVEQSDQDGVEMGAPDAKLALTGRSGPIVVETEYCVLIGEAREFYGAMQKVGRSRNRNGAYHWSIARDIANPALWTERFLCPTWLDYLRHRDRFTAAELTLQAAAEAFHRGADPPRVRRMLERPFGSVRWKNDAPDQGNDEVLPIIAA